MSRFSHIVTRGLGLGVVLLSHIVSAAEIVVIPPERVRLPEVNTDPGVAIASIIRYFLLLAGILAVMAITWGGINFILSSGDDEKIKKARKTIIYAFAGLILAGLAYSIVSVIMASKIITP